MQKPRVTRNEALRVFDLLCDAAWQGMGEEVLGTSRRLLHDTYEAFLIKGAMPLSWVEAPLLGAPHADLHVSYDYHEVCAGVRSVPLAGFCYQGLIEWLSKHGRPGVGVDYSIDLTETGIGAVGAYVIFRDGDGEAADLDGLCASMGCEDYASRCHQIAEAFSAGWKFWCVNPFPGRAGNPVRATGLLTEEYRRRFAENPSAVRESFARMGLSSPSDEFCVRVSKLATLPIQLELRIGIDEQGVLCDRTDVSFYLAQRHLSTAKQRALFAEGGAGRQALEWFEEWDIADARWQTMAQGGFSKAVRFTRDDGSTCRVALLCSPVCFMMPWEKDKPLAAKAYTKLEGFIIA